MLSRRDAQAVDAAADIVARAAGAPHILAHRLTKRHTEPYRLFPYICHLGRAIAETVMKPHGRLIVNMGPRTGKSKTISEWTPAWFLSQFPHKRVLLAANSSPLARLYGGRVRDILAENPSLGVKIRGNTSAKDEWETPERGGMKTLGVDEAAMGRGGDLLILDDPYGSWADGQSPAVRRNIYQWYMATAESRLEPKASVIILHHRMHTDDLTGQLLRGPDGARWRHLSLPSLALPGDPLGRAPGEAICPTRYTREELEAKRVAMGAAFEALHQQNPLLITAGGAYPRFSTANIDHTIELRPDLPLQISVDFNINPGMHVYIGQFDPMADTLTCTHEIHGPGMSVEAAMAELGRVLRAMPHRWKEVEVFGDSANPRSIMTGVTSYQIITQALDGMGLRVSLRVPKGAPRIVDRLNTMNHTLRDGAEVVRYLVHPRCTRLVRDFTSVQLDAKGQIDKTDRDLTHSSDAEGYRVWRLRGMRIELPRSRYGV